MPWLGTAWFGSALPAVAWRWLDQGGRSAKAGRQPCSVESGKQMAMTLISALLVVAIGMLVLLTILGACALVARFNDR
jgi:hypothetical protein